MTICASVNASTKVKQDSIFIPINQVVKAVSIKKDDGKTSYYVVLKTNDSNTNLLVLSNKRTAEFVTLCKEQKYNANIIGVCKKGRIVKVTTL